MVSILSQRFTNWECIIVNDGSTDNTENIALSWCKKDSRFQYIKKENGGLSSARNAGLRIANGDYIQFLDADDWVERDKLYRSMELIYKNPQLDVVVTNFKVFSNNKIYNSYCQLSQNILNYESILLGWDFDFTIPIHCGLFKKNILKNGIFDENLSAKEDWLFWLGLYERSPRSIFINESLVVYRFHNKSLSANSDLMRVNNVKALMYLFEKINPDFKKKYLSNYFDKSLLKFNLLNSKYKNILSSRSYKLIQSLQYPINLLKRIITIMINLYNSLFIS